jgi:hypothetical protein
MAMYTPRRLTKPPTSRHDTMTINGVVYVPLSPGLSFVRELQANKNIHTFTPQDYQEALRKIDRALTKLGGPLTTDSFPYADRLYPKEALTILALSRTCFWPGDDVDAILETMLTQWLRETISDTRAYTHMLWDAINTLGSSQGVFLRLNLNCVAGISQNRITVTTRFGTVTQERAPRRDTLQGVARERIKNFLRHQNAYCPDLSIVYNRLKQIHNQYNLEQALVGWMGYVVLRTIPEGGNNRFNSEQQRLLIALVPSSDNQ